MPTPLNSILLSVIASLLSVAALARGGPNPCAVVQPIPSGLNPPTKLHVPAPNGTALYGTLFGIQIAARKANLGGTVIIAVGSYDTKKIEIFFLDAVTASVTQPHISLGPMPDWVPGATGMKMGDVNNDSLPDIVLNLRGQGKVAFFLASLSGGALTYPVSPDFLLLPSPAPSGTYPYNLAVGNLVGDGGDEIAVTELGTSSGKKVTPNKIHLFRWSGVSFTHDRTIVAPGGSGVIASIAMGDVIGDGAPDLAVSDPKANRDTGRVYVYEGGAADFSTVVEISRGVSGELFGVEIAAGKIKGNSFSDLISATFASSAYVYPGPLDTPPTPPDTLAAGQANSLAAGDVNGDLLADLVVGDPFSCGGAGAAYVFLSNPGILPVPIPVPLPVTEKSYVLGPPEIVGPSSGVGFGFRVQAVDGTQLLIISAKSIPVGSNGSGQVYVYQVN